MADVVQHHENTVNVKKKGKKRKISKHIADAKMKHGKLDSTDTGINDSSNVTVIPTPAALTATPSKKQKLAKHTKDPVDVEGYLMAWKKQQDLLSDGSRITTAWKFNKNTQSWLIRHLYDTTKISKSIFAIALQYFLKSNINVQQRLRDDATQRAILYQQHQQEKGTTNHINDGIDNDDSNANQNETEDSPEVLLEKNHRKEYKRARKILDTLVVTDNVTVG
jgi:WKF domain